MHGARVALQQLTVATVAVAAISALVGFLVVHFGGWTGSVQGVGWGLVVGGGLVGLAAGGSGSPSEMYAGGVRGAFGTYWSQSSALPQNPLALALGGLLVFAGGLALLVLA